ncbi:MULTISPECIES: allophanate hydrolase [unclassified Yoonia]|uniref:allophanate hydrolase n=1 Tax=unclassified Yoonia TaxID=2629118 RepID=UPI002AFE0947|nr:MULTISPECIES: allophanate hydrolase [unclassified Yoonia]
MMFPEMLTIEAVRHAYAKGATPLDLAEEIIARRHAASDPAIFITPVADDDLRAAARDVMAGPSDLPLWGIPYVAKDNIDVAGLPTTAGCPAYAYDPAQDAAVIARLRAAGALCIGKTNLDQFATGLNGTRSPHGAPRSVFDADYVSGGSSSGSAVAVASGLATFGLGTDTAGSGRVPAAFNNLVGIKPTPGLVPNTGVVPACRSVDVVTVFAGCVGDGIAVRAVMDGVDAGDGFTRPAQPVGIRPKPRIGVLAGAEREFYGNAAYVALYDAAIVRAESLGATIVPFDYAPFREAAALLYDGPWVAERLAAVEDFYATNATDFDPTVGGIIGAAGRYSAVDAFNGRYRLEELRAQVAPVWDQVDLLLLPTSPTIYKVADMLADPVTKNSHFGRYTNFANLLGYAAIAVPAGITPDGLPGGVTLIGPAFSDDGLAPFADAMHQAAGCGMGRDTSAAIPALDATTVPKGMIALAVVGAHLTGMPLNHQLTDAGGRLIAETTTEARYRLYALDGTVPPKPGLIRDPDGAAIKVEIWALPDAGFGRFVTAIPAPLGIGKLILADGSTVSGFLCEPHAITNAKDITDFGGWRAYCASL